MADQNLHKFAGGRQQLSTQSLSKLSKHLLFAALSEHRGGLKDCRADCTRDKIPAWYCWNNRKVSLHRGNKIFIQMFIVFFLLCFYRKHNFRQKQFHPNVHQSDTNLKPKLLPLINQEWTDGKNERMNWILMTKPKIDWGFPFMLTINFSASHYQNVFIVQTYKSRDILN